MLKLICSFFVIPLGLIEADLLAKLEVGFGLEIKGGGGSRGGCQSFYRCCWAGGSRGPCHPATNQISAPEPAPDRGSGLIHSIDLASGGVPYALAQYGDVHPARPENPPFSGGSYGSRIEVNGVQGGGCQFFFMCCWVSRDRCPCHSTTNPTPGTTSDRSYTPTTAMPTTSTGPPTSKKPDPFDPPSTVTITIPDTTVTPTVTLKPITSSVTDVKTASTDVTPPVISEITTNPTPGTTSDRSYTPTTAMPTTSTGPPTSKKPDPFDPPSTVTITIPDTNVTSSVKYVKTASTGVTLPVTLKTTTNPKEPCFTKHYKPSHNCFWNLAKAIGDECERTSQSYYIYMYESFKLIRNDDSKVNESSFLEELAKRSRSKVPLKFQHRVTCCLDEHKSKIHEYSELDRCNKCRTRRTMKRLDHALRNFHRCLLRKPEIHWDCECEDE